MHKGARGAEPSTQPPRPLRRAALLVTGISGVIAILAGLITSIVEESADPMHPIGNLGWFAFPAGFVAVGGLIVLLGDALVSGASSRHGPDAASSRQASTRQPGGALRPALLAYGIGLLVGALGMTAITVYDQDSRGLVGYGVFLCLCAAGFIWDGIRVRGPSVSPVQGMRNNGEGSVRGAGSALDGQVLRVLGLGFTGVGTGLAVAMFWVAAFLNEFFWSGVNFGAIWFGAFGVMVAAGGLAILVVNGLLRLTGRRY